MQEQPDLEWRRVQAIDELAAIVRIEPLRRLHLDHDHIIDDEINPVGCYWLAIVKHRHVHFANDPMS